MSLATQLGAQWDPERTWYTVRFAPFGVGLARYLATAYYFRRAFDPPATERHAPAGELSLGRRLSETLERELRPMWTSGTPIILLPISPVISLDAARARGGEEYQQYVPLWRQIILEINGTLEHLAQRERRIYFVDIAGEMDRSADKDRLFLDFIHYTVEGNRYVARRLLETIVDERILR
jgi:hypothetical protein